MDGLASKSGRCACRGAIYFVKLAFIASTSVLLSACVPMSNGGAVIPPPADESNAEGPRDDTPLDQPPSGNGPADDTPDPDAPVEDAELSPLVTTSVFDVSIAASSLFVTGITIDATLTVTFDTEGDSGVTRVTAIHLEDVFNDLSGGVQSMGLVGGISVAGDIAPPPNSGVFTIQIEGDAVLAVLPEAVSGDPGVFILQPDGFVFDPGVIGITYRVEAGSSLMLTVTGDAVDGSFNLVGSPVSGAADTDVYIGTFTGGRRP